MLSASLSNSASLIALTSLSVTAVSEPPEAGTLPVSLMFSSSRFVLTVSALADNSDDSITQRRYFSAAGSFADLIASLSPSVRFASPAATTDTKSSPSPHFSAVKPDSLLILEHRSNLLNHLKLSESKSKKQYTYKANSNSFKIVNNFLKIFREVWPESFRIDYI